MVTKRKTYMAILLVLFALFLTYSVLFNVFRATSETNPFSLPNAIHDPQFGQFELRKTSFLLDTQHPRIAIIIVWISGEYPPWMDLFVESCKANQPTFDWFFFSTVPILGRPKNRSPNVYFFDGLEMKNIEQRFSERLGFEVHLTAAKLNDFKPVFGSVFTDYLAGYSHWGWSDLDLFYGDLQSVICLEELNYFDIYTILGEDSRKLHLAGQFTIMKMSWVANTYWSWPPHAFEVIHNNSGFTQYDEYGASDGLYWKQYRKNEPKIKVMYSSKQFSGYIPGNYSYVWTNGHLLRYPRDSEKAEAELKKLETWWNSGDDKKIRQLPSCGTKWIVHDRILPRDLSCSYQICINTQDLVHSVMLMNAELYQVPTPSSLSYKHLLEGAFYHIGPQKWSIDYKCTYVATAKWVLKKSPSYEKDLKMDFLCEDYDEQTAKRIEVS